MSITQKDFLSKWLPSFLAIVACVVQVATFSIWLGRIDQRLAAVEAHAGDKVVHMPESVKFATFVPRTEFNAQVTRRDQEFDKIHRAIESMNSKLDRLIERRVTGDN